MMHLTDDALNILAEMRADAYDPDLERETEADVAAYWAAMDDAVALRRWEEEQEVSGGEVIDPIPF